MSDTTASNRRRSALRGAPAEVPAGDPASITDGGDGRKDPGGLESAGRPWYHPRPQPRRPMDVLGFNGTWWAAILVAYVAFELLWWSWWL